MRITLAITALTSAVLLTGCAGNTSAAGQAGGAADGVAGVPVPSAAPSSAAVPSSAATASPTAETTTGPAKSAAVKSTAKGRTSDVSELRDLGITLDEGVLLDVADDGADRWLAVGKNGNVDFTGTTRTDTTMMALKPAPGGAKNRVVIKPPFWNEEVGGGYCVADTAGAPLKLEECTNDRDAQIWQVVPAGDSGQFELKGKYGILRVDNGKLTTGSAGRTGLQTIKYAS